MANSINDIFVSMNERALISLQVATYRDFTQAEVFFRLAWAKSERVHALRERFKGRRIERIFVGAGIDTTDLQRPGLEVVPLPRDYFERALGDDLPGMLAQLAGAIVIVNNNHFAVGESAWGVVRLFGQADDTVFLGWDWDNHHWMDASLLLAAHCDLYFPAHNENMYLLSKMNTLTCGPVPCATVQWSQAFLRSRLPVIVDTPRSNEPLGMHVYYEAFGLRNQTVVTLGKHFPKIGFAQRSYEAKSAEDRLQEWVAHKAHWIIPVLNDLPVRLFDALCTGGIPILPESMRFLAPVSALPRGHVVFYTPQDVIAPHAIVARALALFDEGGAAGVTARVELGLSQHHGSVRLERMLDMARERLEFEPFPAR